jgi:hypothetical protein
MMTVAAQMVVMHFAGVKEKIPIGPKNYASLIKQRNCVASLVFTTPR